MQLIDLKSKALWSGKFTELKSKLKELEILEYKKVDGFKRKRKVIARVEELIFDAWYSLPDCHSEENKLAF